jgi:hypothetical protein
VNRIFFEITKISDMDAYYIAHNIVEHEEAGCLLECFFRLMGIDQKEYGR